MIDEEQRDERRHAETIDALVKIADAIEVLAEAVMELKPEPEPKPQRTIFSPRPPQRADLPAGSGAQAWAQLEEQKKAQKEEKK